MMCYKERCFVVMTFKISLKEYSLLNPSHSITHFCGCRSVPGSMAVCGWHLADVQQRLAVQPQNIPSLQVLLQARWGLWARDWSCHAEPWLLLWKKGRNIASRTRLCFSLCFLRFCSCFHHIWASQKLRSCRTNIKRAFPYLIIW